MEIRFKTSRSFFNALTALLKSFLLLLSLLIFAVFSGCKKEMDYRPYVSELRSNILLANEGNFTLRIYAVNKETPYIPDGIPHECTNRVEIYLIAPEGKENCKLYFTFDGQEYGGDMSYDNVKSEYFFSRTLDISKAKNLTCRVEYGDKIFNLTAVSIQNEHTMDAMNILKALKISEPELFTSLTDEYGFAGEIYIRLIYEENPYYYVGIIDRSGNIHAFLLNAQTGKILAKRTS